MDMEGGRKRRSFSLMSSSVRPSKRNRVCERGRGRGGREEREGKEREKRGEREITKMQKSGQTCGQKHAKWEGRGTDTCR